MFRGAPPGAGPLGCSPLLSLVRLVHFVKPPTTESMSINQ